MSEETPQNSSHDNRTSIPLQGMYKQWYLEYASYVILDRAVPSVQDGLKPVQRRILHAMRTMHDGRYHKVANIIGNTMQYHPHGDAAIGDALVNMGQKDLLIDTQGNWGDYRTGDSAAAPRYIEARLTPFALDVAFNPRTTEWLMSYDGRNKEPENLPMKFPMVLAHGAEGIAVGLSTKILPHNFQELIKACVDHLKGRSFKLFPDFQTGGLIDVSQYNAGKRGGKVRVRARIDVKDKKTLIISEIPYGQTTQSVIDSIIKANDSGKLKIKKVEDNTAAEVEIAVTVTGGISPEVTVDALYAFTNCEVSISPNACIIEDKGPKFVSVHDILKTNVMQTVELLRWELKLRLSDLLELWHMSSLERIFIENRIYRDIEECETWEDVISTIDTGLDPFKEMLHREVTRDDIIKLTEIKIKRISKYDSFKADELIRKTEGEIEEVKSHLEHITDYTINYFQSLLKKYGEGKERKTEIATFDAIQRSVVAVNNAKLYVNRKEGFVGTGLKKDEFVEDCSDIDSVIVIRADGKYSVSKVSDKQFFGKNIVHVGVWKKGEDRKIYHAVYQDGATGPAYVKRFAVTAITRDREYDITKGASRSKLHYLSVHDNAEAEVVRVLLSPNQGARKREFEFDFSELAIKGRSAGGNKLSKYRIRSVTQVSVGASTMGGRDIWLDESIGRLNYEERGQYIGAFEGEDRILVLYEDGSYELTDFDPVNNRYTMSEIACVVKLEQTTVVSAVYKDGASRNTYVKRFEIETSTTGRRFPFISEEPRSKLIAVSTLEHPKLKYTSSPTKDAAKKQYEVDLTEFIEVKGWKSIGNKLDTGYRASGFSIVASESNLLDPQSEDDA